jgi:hypothetical protein
MEELTLSTLFREAPIEPIPFDALPLTTPKRLRRVKYASESVPAQE